MKNIKKLLVYLLVIALVLAPLPVFAKGLWGGQNVKYRGTITGLRISAVDGTALLDACAALVPYADGNHLVEIYDPSNRKHSGYLKAQGAGETWDSELLTNGDMELDSGWEDAGTPTANERSNTQVHGGTYSRKFTADADQEGIISVALAIATRTSGALYKLGSWIYADDTTAYKLYVTDGTNATVLPGASNTLYTVTKDAWTQHNFYFTEKATGNTGRVAYKSSAAGTWYIDDVSNKKVLTPSTDGVTIVNSKGGATYNWLYKHASFTYNAASYFVIVKKVR